MRTGKRTGSPISSNTCSLRARRRSARQIAREIDSVGGILNAFTSKEFSSFYAKVMAEHLPIALDLLFDLYLNSTFSAEEMEKERQVIVQEISMVEDTPDEYIHDLFNESFWPRHPMGFPILGRLETVEGLSRTRIKNFFAENYLPTGDLSNSPTAAHMTNPGAMIGTVGYLSPEQARGDLADHRSDIFSLGAVLYEMLTGHRAFKGTSPAELLSSVLRDEPGLSSESDPRIPRALDLIVHHCLEKSPDERFQSARDLAFHLDSLGGTSATQRASAVALPQPRRSWRWLPAGIAALVLAGACSRSDGASARRVARAAGAQHRCRSSRSPTSPARSVRSRSGRAARASRS